MPRYCVDQASRLIDDIKDAKVTVLGLAFRGGVSDTRLSPTYEVVKELVKSGAGSIRVHDPLVKVDHILPKEVTLTSDLKEALDGSDLIMLVTDHPEYRSIGPKITGSVPVYDGRGILDWSVFPHGQFASIGRPAS